MHDPVSEPDTPMPTPSSRSEPGGADSTPRGAASVPGVLTRGLGRALDVLVHVGVMELAFQLAQYLPDQGLLTPSEEVQLWIDISVGIGALVIYTSLAEWRNGATLGKVLTGTEVRTLSDGPPSLLASVVRGAAFLVDALFLGLIAYSAMSRSRERQRLGDLWAGTYVAWRSVERTGRFTGVVVGVTGALTWVMASYLLIR